MNKENKLLDKVSVRHSNISIFLNKGKKGEFLSFRPDKGYRDATGEYRYAQSFTRDELKDLKLAIEAALEFKKEDIDRQEKLEVVADGE